ncbi:MAG TPA: hypothetical protein VIP05_26350 [Burkholderiaceae bacterium]
MRAVGVDAVVLAMGVDVGLGRIQPFQPLDVAPPGGRRAFQQVEAGHERQRIGVGEEEQVVGHRRGVGQRHHALHVGRGESVGLERAREDQVVPVFLEHELREGGLQRAGHARQRGRDGLAGRQGDEVVLDRIAQQLAATRVGVVEAIAQRRLRALELRELHLDAAHHGHAAAVAAQRAGVDDESRGVQRRHHAHRQGGRDGRAPGVCAAPMLQPCVHGRYVRRRHSLERHLAGRAGDLDDAVMEADDRLRRQHRLEKELVCSHVCLARTKKEEARASSLMGEGSPYSWL